MAFFAGGSVDAFSAERSAFLAGSSDGVSVVSLGALGNTGVFLSIEEEGSFAFNAVRSSALGALLELLAGVTGNAFAVSLSESFRAGGNAGVVVEVEAVLALVAGRVVIAFEALGAALGAGGDFAGSIDVESAGAGGVAKSGGHEDEGSFAFLALFSVSFAVIAVLDVAFLAGFTNDGLSLGASVDAIVFIEVEVGGASLADFAVR